MLSREARKESRKRGSARRVIDLDDFVFETPPIESSSQSQSQSQSQSRSKSQMKSLPQSPLNSQVIRSPQFSGTLAEIPESLTLESEFSEKAKKNNASQNKRPKLSLTKHDSIDDSYHQDAFQQVLKSNSEFQQPSNDYTNFIKKGEDRILTKHNQLVKTHRGSKVQKNSDKNAKNKITKNKSKKSKTIEKSRSKTIQIKYRRIPTNKTKLLAIDVISQIFEDYFSNQNNLNKLIYKYNQKNNDKSMNELNTKLNFKKFLKDYKRKVSAYFADLIDLQLSNNLILNDLNKVNSEKNKIRLDIFNIREARNVNSLELKDLRNKFSKMRESYGLKARMYKELLELQKIKSNYNGLEDGNVIKDDDYKNLEGLIEWRLNHLRNTFGSETGLINKLKNVNELLRNLYENI